MRTIVDLDCGEIPPGCGFQCGICVQEIKDTLESLDGVVRFSQHLDNRIEVEHDPEKISQEDLLEVISKLPTGQNGSFILRVVDT